MKISQSILRDLVGDYCPQFIKLRHIDKIQTEPTQAMKNGLAFESKLIGASRDGEYEMAKKKNGEKYAAELEVDRVVDYARAVLNEAVIRIDTVQVAVERTINDDLIATGHVDAFGSIKNKPIIIDVKFTGLAFSQYEKEMQWSPLTDNLRTQARQYQYIDKEDRDFLFLVFSSKGWSRFFGVQYEEALIEQHEQRIIAAHEELSNLDFNDLSNVDANTCNACALRDVCKKRKFVPIIEPLPF